MLTSSRHTGRARSITPARGGAGQDRPGLARVALERDHLAAGGQQGLRLPHCGQVAVDVRRVGQCRHQPLRGLPVDGEMILPAEQVIVDARDVRPR